MKTVPIVEHLQADPPRESLRAVERLAKRLREERPELALPDQFRDLAPSGLDDGPTLHIDDLSEIPNRLHHVGQEDLARRAVNGLVLSS